MKSDKHIKKQLFSGESEELEQSLLSNPRDEETWAVYGDWLQSQEDPAGELLALSIASEKEPNNAEIKARVRKLEISSQEFWLGNIQENADASPNEILELDLDWRYGFVLAASIRLKNSQSLKILTALLKSDVSKFLSELEIFPDEDKIINDVIQTVTQEKVGLGLRHLKLCATTKFDANKIISSLPNLEKLILWRDVQFSKRAVHKNLTSLDLQIRTKPQFPLSLITESDFPALESLNIFLDFDFSGTNEARKYLECLGRAESLPELKDLHITNYSSGNQIFKILIPSPLLPQLEGLYISCQELNEENGRFLLENQKSLSHLNSLFLFLRGSVDEEIKETLKKAFANRIAFI